MRIIEFEKYFQYHIKGMEEAIEIGDYHTAWCHAWMISHLLRTAIGQQAMMN